MKTNRISQRLWALAGFASFGLGALGAVLPIVPTTPFLLVAAFCFARSSGKLNAWFRSTKLYRVVIEGYATKRAMTLKSKLLLLGPLTAVLIVSFALMANVPVGRVVVAAVWVAHIAYFGFVVKTDRTKDAAGVSQAELMGKPCGGARLSKKDAAFRGGTTRGRAAAAQRMD